LDLNKIEENTEKKSLDESMEQFFSPLPTNNQDLPELESINLGDEIETVAEIHTHFDASGAAGDTDFDTDEYF
jgi:hypothetical protein